MSDNTEPGAVDMGCDTAADGDHCVHGFHSTAWTAFNEDGAFDGVVVEAQLAHDTEKESGASITVLPIGPDGCV